jgi:predicted DNA binding CopG/RHH family protein
MKKEKTYVKNIDDEMYENVEWEYEKSQQERENRLAKKKPTSIALNEETIADLKKLAEIRGIPYQVLMRSYILEGLRKDKKSF